MTLFVLGLLAGVILGFGAAAGMLKHIQVAVDRQMSELQLVLAKLIEERKHLAEDWKKIKDELEWRSV